MANVPLKFITVPAVGKHIATVIFLHGLGDTGAGWKPIADMFSKDPSLSHVKWILPHSPIQPVSVNMGMSMPSWYDIRSFDANAPEDDQGMNKSVVKITELIKQEVDSNGIDPSRIVLGGFSQGATLTLLTGLTGQHKLAGLIALSGRLPLKHKFKEIAVQNLLSTPVFWGTGSEDPLVPVKLANELVDILVNVVGVPKAKPGLNGGVTYKVYDGMEHSSSPEELEDIRQFLKVTLAAK